MYCVYPFLYLSHCDNNNYSKALMVLFAGDDKKSEKASSGDVATDSFSSIFIALVAIMTVVTASVF